jgi:transporter family-2 protein
MPAQPSFATAAGIMFLSGIGIPILAALNGVVGKGLDHPVMATVMTFLVGLVIALLLLAISGGPPPLARFAAVSPPYYLGAAFMVFYALAVTFFAPRIGVGNAVFFVLLGQLVAAAAIDHFGLLHAAQFPLTPRRILGIAVMALGVWLAKRTV